MMKCRDEVTVSNDHVSSPAPSDQMLQQKSNRNGYLMLAVILGPMIAAYLVFKTGLGMPTGTINKGELLTPAKLLFELNASDVDGNAVHWDQFEAHWRFLVPIMAPCEADCEQALYLTRQVHKRLNEKYPKVARWVLVDRALWNPALAQTLANEYQDSETLLVDAAEWHQWLAQTNSRDAIYYMVDNQGFAMMFYQRQHSGNDLLADIKRMLKLTREH